MRASDSDLQQKRGCVNTEITAEPRFLQPQLLGVDVWPLSKGECLEHAQQTNQTWSMQSHLARFAEHKVRRRGAMVLIASHVSALIRGFMGFRHGGPKAFFAVSRTWCETLAQAHQRSSLCRRRSRVVHETAHTLSDLSLPNSGSNFVCSNASHCVRQKERSTDRQTDGIVVAIRASG